MRMEQKFIGLMFDGTDSYKTHYEGYRPDCIKEFVEMCDRSGAKWGTLIIEGMGHAAYHYRQISSNEKLVKEAVYDAIENGEAWRHVVCKLVDRNEELDEDVAFRWACEAVEPLVNPWDHCEHCHQRGGDRYERSYF